MPPRRQKMTLVLTPKTPPKMALTQQKITINIIEESEQKLDEKRVLELVELRASHAEERKKGEL